jgi:cyclohexadienyl dehydratase
LSVRAITAALVLGVMLAAATHASPPPREARRFAALLAKRLGTMRDVAAWKRHHGLPVEDPAREQRVREASGRAAARLGFEVTSTLAFVDRQMEVAKAVQRHWLRRWETSGAPPAAPADLETRLRPRIARVSDMILRHLVLALPSLAREDVRRTAAAALHTRLAASGVTTEQAAGLVRAAAAVGHAPHSAVLERVVARRVLRVGTTGDYPPFSERRGETVAGIDARLARDLAASLDVRLRFVATTWPTLLADLAADRFDVALSGIGRTPERARAGYLSAPYHRGGKTPIVRCGTETRFDTLAKIDQPGVRVVVNRGGANERFVRARLARASVRVIDDNAQVFEEVAAGRADVMITDRIEVAYRTARDPRLCAAQTGAVLVAVEKVALMPRDVTWSRYVDAWLDRARRTGVLGRAFDQAP